MSRPYVRIGRALLTMQFLLLGVEPLVAARSRAPYSFVSNTISDLGAATCTTIHYPAGAVPVCSPLHAWMNAAFILSGLALIFGVAGVASALRPGRGRTWAVAVSVACGLSAIATGLVPLDQDLDLHTLVSIPAVVGGIGAWLFVAASSLGGIERHACILLAAVSTIAGAITLAWLDNPAMGLTERIGIWVAALVWAWVGLRGTELEGNVSMTGVTR